MSDYKKLINKRIRKLEYHIDGLPNESDIEMREMLREYFEYELKYLKIFKKNLEILAEYGCLEFPIVGLDDD